MAKNEGARKAGKFMAICTTPDVCKTPVGNTVVPIPYPITSNLNDSMSVSSNVNFGGDPAYVHDKSKISKVTGDEPGTAGGVKSGTNRSMVETIKGSSTVNVNKKPVVRHTDPCKMNNGNTMGKVIYQGTSKSASGISSDSNPPAKPETPQEETAKEEKKGLWSKLSDGVHTALDVAGFIPGLGAIPDILNAGIYAAEGNVAMAALSVVAAVPGVGDGIKAGTMVVKGGKAIAKQAAKKTGKKLTKEAAEKTEKELVEKAVKEKTKKETAKKTSESSTKKKGKDGLKESSGKKKKKKKKMKCGESGKYGDLKKKTGEGKFDRDHVPSKAALKERATELAEKRGEPITPSQLKTIENMADAIAIPKKAHQQKSPTYGKRNTTTRIKEDASDLNKAAGRDLDAMEKDMGKYNKRCSKAYKKAAEQLRKKIQNNDRYYDDYLNNILDNFK